MLNVSLSVCERERVRKRFAFRKNDFGCTVEHGLQALIEDSK